MIMNLIVRTWIFWGTKTNENQLVILIFLLRIFNKLCLILWLLTVGVCNVRNRQRNAAKREFVSQVNNHLSTMQYCSSSDSFSTVSPSGELRKMQYYNGRLYSMWAKNSRNSQSISYLSSMWRSDRQAVIGLRTDDAHTTRSTDVGGAVYKSILN